MTTLEHAEVSCWDEILDGPATAWLNRYENGISITLEVDGWMRKMDLAHPFTHVIQRTIHPDEGAWRLSFARVQGSPYADQCVRFPEEAARVLRDILSRVCTQEVHP